MSSERDYSPLSPSCVRALTDKVIDKRRAAAFEIENMVRGFIVIENITQIRRLLKVLGQDFGMSKNPTIKKGGLIGLAAVAIGLGNESVNYIDDLVIPILVNMNDSDLKVRYYACESLYNVSKIAQASVLKHFLEIFKLLNKMATDYDVNIKNSSEHLNGLIKDIVAKNPNNLDLESFIPLLREGINSNDIFAKKFIVSWIIILNDIPSIDLVIYLPELLDGLFKMLSELTLETKKMCDIVFMKFLDELRKNPKRVQNYTDMINTVVIYSHSIDEYVQFTSLYWMKELIEMYGSKLLPFTSSILTALMDSNLFKKTDSQMDIKQIGKLVNSTLMKIIEDENNANEDLQGLVLESVITVLTNKLGVSTIETKIIVLKWFYHLFIHLQQKTLAYLELIFPILLETLSCPNEEVVQTDLKVIALVISIPAAGSINKKYLEIFIIYFLKESRSDDKLMKNQTKFIISELCSLLNPEHLYRILSKLLLEEENMKFANIMVELLNTILLTSPELSDLRIQLRNVKKEENHEIFLCLFQTWCHSPLATVALCLYTQHYFFVHNLFQILPSMDLTIDVDKLIQLLESPVFVYLRMELLDESVNPYLVQALYALLMIMPQSNAFHLLKNRLNCIPNFNKGSKRFCNGIKINDFKGVFDLKMMLKHFTKLHEKYKTYQRNKNSILMIEETIAKIDL